jgi:hypothetical protein
MIIFGYTLMVAKSFRKISDTMAEHRVVIKTKWASNPYFR